MGFNGETDDDEGETWQPANPVPKTIKLVEGASTLLTGAAALLLAGLTI